MAKVPIGLRIDPDLLAVLEREAEAGGRSLSAQIEYLLTRALRAKLAAWRAQQTTAAAEQSETEA